MRVQFPPLCGRDHLAYRSSYAPVKVFGRFFRILSCLISCEISLQLKRKFSLSLQIECDRRRSVRAVHHVGDGETTRNRGRTRPGAVDDGSEEVGGLADTIRLLGGSDREPKHFTSQLLYLFFALLLLSLECSSLHVNILLFCGSFGLLELIVGIFHAKNGGFSRANETFVFLI